MAVSLIIRVLVAIVFVWAGVTKLLDLHAFSEILLAYKLFPESTISFLVYYIPILEFFISLALLLPKTSKVGSWAAFTLFVIFEATLLSLIVRGIDGDCGCFGKFGGTPKWAFIKNIFFLLLIVYSMKSANKE
ncbi:MAG: DoxX family membrane protein [Lentisphaeraceae bacterium]|nr:DoxX family membrane protein [Lentisphaeraceae bacterium]